MCRIYGFRSNEPTKVECTLVHAQNALLAQSRSDHVGKSHPHGWGIGLYENGAPQIERRPVPAFDDLHFSVTAERVFARTVVAHVRKATVGKTALENTHPFSYGRWMFAHNGTVTAFDRVLPVLEAETLPRFRGLARGATDSETLFYWLLSRMVRAGVDPDRSPADPGELAAVVAAATPRVDRLCEEAGCEKPARLNQILTDGEVLVAVRWRRTLHWVERPGLHDCEICGIPHVHRTDSRGYRATIVASEPISHDEPWREVPEYSVVAVDGGIRTAIHRL